MALDIPSLADLCENEAISIKVSCRRLMRPAYKPDKSALLREARIWRLNAEQILKLASDLEKIANEKQ